MKIYKIILNEKVIYVGKTKLDLSRRHQLGHPYYPEYKMGQIELIEETDNARRERFWIEFYRNLGEPLLNKQNGDGFIKELDDKFDYKSYLKVYRIAYYQKNKEYYKNYNKKRNERLKNNEKEI